jgi:hypothetical protein
MFNEVGKTALKNSVFRCCGMHRENFIYLLSVVYEIPLSGNSVLFKVVSWHLPKILEYSQGE